jgi:hypothetical protein
MLRNLIVVAIGVALSFVLAFVGSHAAWVLYVGSGPSTNKEGIVRFMVAQTFVVNPGTAIIVAVFVASLVQRSRWWFGGIALLPLVTYGLIRGAAGIEIVLLLGYVALAMIVAFVVSRFKREPHFA